jgi:TRAP-type C4-dicarboxylate transport system permease small subunit
MAPHPAPMPSPLRRVEHWLTTINQVLVFVSMLVVLVFTFGQAVDRYAIHSSFDAHDQIAKIGLVWLVFAGTAVAYAQHANLRIDLIAKYLPPVVLRWRDALFELAILAVCMLINVKAWSVLEVVAFQQIMGTPLTNAVPYSAILVGTAAIAFSCVLRLLDALTGKKPAR